MLCLQSNKPCDPSYVILTSLERLCTQQVWVDRTRVRVAYQVKDAEGSVRVTRPSRVEMRLSLPGAPQQTSSCDTSYTQDSSQLYVAYCSSTLPASWFVNGTAGRASIVVALRTEDNSADLATATGSLTVITRPAWFDYQLRTSTLGNSLNAPADLNAPNGGVFMTLPSSPVYAGESFDVFVCVASIE